MVSSNELDGKKLGQDTVSGSGGLRSRRPSDQELKCSRVEVFLPGG
jgi:hypothetical protein